MKIHSKYKDLFLAYCKMCGLICEEVEVKRKIFTIYIFAFDHGRKFEFARIEEATKKDRPYKQILDVILPYSSDPQYKAYGLIPISSVEELELKARIMGIM